MNHFNLCKDLLLTSVLLIVQFTLISQEVTYTVTATDDLDDGFCDAFHCSLREVIQLANSDNVPSRVEFDLSDNRILIGSVLPKLTETNTIIDGSTQPIDGYVILDAPNHPSSSINSVFYGMHLDAENCEVYGIQFQDFASGIIANKDDQIIGSLAKPNRFINNVNQDIWIGGIRDNITIEGNYLGTNEAYDQLDTKVLNIGIFSGSGATDNIYIKNNVIGYKSWAINSYSSVNLSENIFLCNNDAIRYSRFATIPVAPTIKNVNSSIISGSSAPNYSIEVYRSNFETCTSCQANEFLGSTVADNSGNWNIPTSLNITVDNNLLAISKSPSGQSSDFSSCYVVLPDDCVLAQALPINSASCSSVGVVMDLTQLTSSPTSIQSACSNTFTGNDVWLTITVPSTGNVLVRANTANQVVPVIEAYVGECDQLTALTCEVLDSLPFAMIFQGYTPGTKVYIRIWDENNTRINDDLPFLHLTAHELGVDKNDWVICDNNNGNINNPTLISQREGSSFIINYENNATGAEIENIEQDLLNENLTLSDECLCDSKMLQLWTAESPIGLEGVKRRSRLKAKVDTTTYNYIFENIEFQVNSFAIGQQVETDVAMDREGNFVMVWVDQQRRHNYGRFYSNSGNALTSEFRIGESDKVQSSSRIEMLGDSSFMVSWLQEEEGFYRIFARTLKWEGLILNKGPLLNISAEAANSLGPNHLLFDDASYGVNVEMSFNGEDEVLFTWQSGPNVFVQKYSIDGTPIGDILVVCKDLDTSLKQDPVIKSDASKNFVISWVNIDSNGRNIVVKKFDENSNEVYFKRIEKNDDEEQEAVDIALLNNDQSIVTWESKGREGSRDGYGIYAQILDSDGREIGQLIHVNTYTTNDQRAPAITAFDDGTFYISWSSFEQDGYLEGIFGQLFNANGSRIGEEFQVNKITIPEQENPRSANNGESLFITTWEDGGNDGSFKGIFGQRYELNVDNGEKEFYAIGTTTPSLLLGEEMAYPESYYYPSDEVSAVRVAIIDSGIDFGHPAIANSAWVNSQVDDSENCVIGDVLGYDFVHEDAIPEDNDGHGTQVAGIIARDFNRDVKLELMNLKFHDSGRGTVFDAICAIHYAVDNGADIINLSWGFEASERPTILEEALQYASDSDVLIVTTAGNTSKNNDLIAKYPANLDIDNLIVVTSYQVERVNKSVSLSSYASYGATNVDIAAYGYVEAPSIGDVIIKTAGTSLAAPSVTRTAATIKGLYPTLTSADIKDCILSASTSSASLAGRVSVGGYLNHDAAISCAKTKSDNCLAIDILHSEQNINENELLTTSFITSTVTLSQQEVKYQAKEYISLEEDFGVTTGTIFDAYIGDCSQAERKRLEAQAQHNEGLVYMVPSSVKKKKVIIRFKPITKKVKIKVTLEQGGLDLSSWESGVLKTKWVEKILDFSDIDAGAYLIEYLDGNKKKILPINIE